MRHIQIEGAITKPNQAWTVNVISTSPETPHTSFWPNSLSLYPVPHIHKSLTLHSSVTVSALWSLSSSPLSPPTLQFLLLQLNATPRYVVVSLSLSLSFMFCFMSYYVALFCPWFWLARLETWWMTTKDTKKLNFEKWVLGPWR